MKIHRFPYRTPVVCRLVEPWIPPERRGEPALQNPVAAHVSELEHRDYLKDLWYPCAINVGAADCVGCAKQLPVYRTYYAVFEIDGEQLIYGFNADLQRALDNREQRLVWRNRGDGILNKTLTMTQKQVDSEPGTDWSEWEIRMDWDENLEMIPCPGHIIRDALLEAYEKAEAAA